ncbi:MAG: M20/M25/M40 family metallo-hydrolase, partial [Actinomycetospora chiangmaiensis]|nr:M20/M25/M40 family metallo-hydrolase [Actinomycetospora chiangmaiensis]
GANGIPTLDGLGPLGQGYHTLEEHLLIDTLPQRARLFAALLADLGAAEAGSPS